MSVYAYTTKKYGRLFGVRYVDLSNGQRKNVRGFKNKREAQAAEFRLIDQSKNVVSTHVVPEEESNDILFSTLFDLYRTTYLVTLAPSTMYDYIKLYNKYIAPTFADRQISSIIRKTVTLWQDALPVGLSSKYKRKIRSFLSSVFTFAVQRDYLEKNPVDNVVPIRNTEPKKEILYWTKEEYDRFISCVGDPTYHALFFFLYNTGCRKGEAFALRWSDLDFANDTVTIRRNLTKKGQMMAAAMGKKIEEHTKNRKTGTIIIPHSLMAELSALPKGEYVFGGKTPLSENTVKRRLDYYIAYAHVKKIHVHCFRHSCAALMISMSGGGIDTLFAIAHRLRDSVSQVLKTYGHLFPNQNLNLTQKINDLF